MEPLALYVHWPFCLHKCPYCDFNSHVREVLPQQRFASALRRELAWEAARLGRRPLGSIFFGGGTPSLMDPGTVAALVEDATTLFEPLPELEVTLEANPTSVEASRLRLFRQAGVNRVSLGVQSLSDASLRELGRQHSAAEAIAALEQAREAFPRLSFDLIYARPGQTPADWQRELRQALSLAADHLSLYQLTVEPGTAFEARERSGALVLPDPELAASLYEATGDEAARAGLLRYEVSNYARPGCEGRHNLSYWRYGDYAGIGPGAHGRLGFPSGVAPARDETGRPRGSGDDPARTPGAAPAVRPAPGRLVATRRHRAPEPWAEMVERQGHGSTAEELVAPADRAREMLLMGLRLREGVQAGRFAERTGLTLDETLDQPMLAHAIDEGYLLRDGERLAATAQGLLRLDSLLAAIVA